MLNRYDHDADVHGADMLVVIVMRISMSLILCRRSLDAGYGRWMLMVCNEYNDDNDDVDGDDGFDHDDDDGDDCDYAIRPMDVFEITNSVHKWMVSESLDVPI